jgi:hypothetical protein
MHDKVNVKVNNNRPHYSYILKPMRARLFFWGHTLPTHELGVSVQQMNFNHLCPAASRAEAPKLL